QRILNCVETVTPDKLAGHGKRSYQATYTCLRGNRHPGHAGRAWEERISGNGYLIAWQPSPEHAGMAWEELMSGTGYLLVWKQSPRTCWHGMGRAQIRQRILNCVATVTPDMLAGHGKSSCQATDT
ncbi:hypothetical protein J6590_072182, partial [Homalodisca vitripennis]